MEHVEQGILMLVIVREPSVLMNINLKCILVAPE